MGHSPHTRDLCPRGCLPSWCLRQNGRVGHFFLRVPGNQEAGCETDGVVVALFGHFSRALSVFFSSSFQMGEEPKVVCLLFNCHRQYDVVGVGVPQLFFLIYFHPPLHDLPPVLFFGRALCK